MAVLLRTRVILIQETCYEEQLMANKFIGYEQVMAYKTKGQPPGKILVKLKKKGERPRWVQMSLKDYEQRSIMK